MSTSWHALATDEVLTRLGSTQRGLDAGEATARLARHGRNEIVAEKEPPWWRLLLSQFNNLLIYILFFAALISFFLGKIVEPIAILVIVLLAGITGFIQEFQASKALQALRRMATPAARVLRDGREAAIPAAELVPGDIVLLEAGSVVPADARIIETADLQVNEAALTGESFPVAKTAAAIDGDDLPLAERRNMLYMGTAVVAGRGRGVVVATGMASEFGKIATMLATAEQRRTPLLENMDRLGRQLGILSLVLAAAASALSLWRGTPPAEVFLWGVALAVAIIPEALPAVVTVTLALGVKRMVGRRALIRRLPAVETLGSVNIICTDKTGTLTQGQMTIRQCYAGNRFYRVSGIGYDPEGGAILHDDIPVRMEEDRTLERLCLYGALCNDAALVRQEDQWLILGDPTEGALLVLARKAGIIPETVRERFPRLRDIPFSSESKKMTTVHRLPFPAPTHGERRTAAKPGRPSAAPEDRNEKSRLVAITKGAPEIILQDCSGILDGDRIEPLTDVERERLLAVSHQFGEQALRVLAVAVKFLADGDPNEMDDPVIRSAHHLDRDLVFVGMVGMLDPPRDDVKAAIQVCEKAGIRPVMITGDQKVTAVAVARELGIAKQGKALAGDELARLDEAAFAASVTKTTVYARIAPEHKLRIVSTLMAQGNTVAMTGDGVNDAPALKKADIGIAMGITGTDVSKEAADMILTDDNFASIVAAVEEGRTIFENIRKYLVFLLGGNMGTVFGLSAALILGFPAPLAAIHILFINFVMDGVLAITLGVEPPEAGTMSRPPRPRREGILNGRSLAAILFTGLWIATVCMAVFSWYGGARPLAHVALSSPYPQTLFFVTLVLARICNCLACRSLTTSFFRYGLRGNRVLLVGIGFTVLLTILVVHLPALAAVFSIVPLSLQDWAVAAAAGTSIILVSEGYKLISRHTQA